MNRPAAAGSEPASVIDHEPDYRFTLANERTFLAWIRTALGLLAAGVAAHQLAAFSPIAGARTAITMCCIALALALIGGAYRRWRSVQQAMRRDQPLPGSALVPMLGAGVGVIVVVVAAALLIS